MSVTDTIAYLPPFSCSYCTTLTHSLMLPALIYSFVKFLVSYQYRHTRNVCSLFFFFLNKFIRIIIYLVSRGGVEPL